MKQIKAVFISESIRRDSHAPLKFFKNIKVCHLYLNAPYGDMISDDLVGSRRVTMNSLMNQIVSEKPDIIQGAEPFGSRLSLKLSYIAYKAAKRSGAKLVVPILENRPIGERFNLIQRLILRLFCPRYFSFASAIIALNLGAQRNIRYYSKKANIITGIVWGVWGVDSELFKPVAKKVKNQIIYVGRWVEEKGVNYLLRGFQMATKEIPSLKLKLYGSGDYESSMKDFVKINKLEKSVEFVGQVKNIELPRYFSESELCVYPSITQRRWEEQVGTVNFQAMACSTPVLTTNSGAIPEYIKDGEGAILVKEKDAKAISRAIIKFFTDKSYKENLQKKSREYVLKYDIKKEIKKAEDLLINIVNEK